MIDFNSENIITNTNGFNPAKFSFDLLDNTLEKQKKNKTKKRKKSKKIKKADRYIQACSGLAFRYGVLASRYDALSRMVELAIATNRNQLNADLLDNGLKALKQPKV